MHFQPNNDAGSRAQGLKLTPFIGDGNLEEANGNRHKAELCLKLTPFIGDGNSKEEMEIFLTNKV